MTNYSREAIEDRIQACNSALLHNRNMLNPERMLISQYKEDLEVLKEDLQKE